jgi:hypothetical protein
MKYSICIKTKAGMSRQQTQMITQHTTEKTFFSNVLVAMVTVKSLISCKQILTSFVTTSLNYLAGKKLYVLKHLLVTLIGNVCICPALPILIYNIYCFKIKSL